jgi:hypothetical protein
VESGSRGEDGAANGRAGRAAEATEERRRRGRDPEYDERLRSKLTDDETALLAELLGRPESGLDEPPAAD